MLSLAEIRAASARIAGRVLRTPALRSDAISQATGADVTLKLENLQATGAFKERGAANRLALLTEAERRAGVIAMSAGNHAQAVARHAHLLGIDAVIVMPRHTPLTKVSRTAAWGARVVLHGDTLAESAEHACVLAQQEGLIFIHPYDDRGVMAGQGTLALELLEDAPDLDTLVIPVGGGGLIAGCAVAATGVKPGIEVIGVEVAAYAALAQRLAGQPVHVGGATIAEGIAVRDIGEAAFGVIRAHVADVLVVPERAVEEAIALLAEGAKLVAEGAGAAGVAALLAFPDRFAGRRVGIPVCGGNIDARILANVLLRNLLRDGRLLRLVMEIPDRPGVLADIAGKIGGAGGNIIEVSHQRLFASPSVQAAQLEVMFEARDAAHGADIVRALEETYTVRRI
ncbi:threonine ammonia-lyase [Limobrevibacterium gyesilva]|uniref:L-threonine dehydratase catabolic TdcB n=1 Tax=Limobrevibacterium gyesilva TaxID=2991712 RepID=A0AA42CJF4_9PROT|nr:threonine ammonia-lyase [Limobrevibacterium gyesilva]MCW3476852.1 threonine ammonia-lyase [Limobrevibacterium gyesilva]